MDSNRKSFLWKDKTILIAEDDIFNFKYLEALLIPTGARIIHASDGNKALEIFNNNRDVDLLLIDIKMPFISGYEVAKEIKKINPYVPVIVQTAYAQASDRETAIESGCDEYISKPIKRDELFRLICKYFEE